MSKNPLKLKIAYLYPDILQSFCDLANVQTFIQRAKLRNIEVNLQEISPNDKIQATKYDFYYIGGSNLNMIDYALKFLLLNKEELKVASLCSVPILAVNMGYMLLCNSFQFNNRTKTPALGLLDVEAIEGKKFYSGNIYGTCEFLKNKTIAGYENHSMLSYLQKNVAPFITLKKGFGNNNKDKTEGAIFNNTIGTYLTSSLLAQNPHLCDFLISTALRIKYKCRIPLTPLCDDIEYFSHNYIIETK